MRKNLIIIALCLLFVAGWTIQTRPTYEYKFDFNSSEKKVNQLAADGWELFLVDAGREGVGSNVSTYIFRRAR